MAFHLLFNFLEEKRRYIVTAVFYQEEESVHLTLQSRRLSYLTILLISSNLFYRLLYLIWFLSLSQELLLPERKYLKAG